MAEPNPTVTRTARPTGPPDTDPNATTGDTPTPSIWVLGPPAEVGRYVFGDELARGGMGVVYRATDTTLGREVAIKVLQEKHSPGSGTARRFADEARIAAQLQHPGIPPVHELGALPDGRPFLAMKLIKGQTLDELLKGRLDPTHDRGRLVAVFEQACHAIAYAHAHRVIHRDLKPANVMVGAFGEVQVMDWGLAKVLPASVGPSTEHGPADDPEETSAATRIESLRDSDGSFTQAGSILGTPAYMPPEQAVGAVGKVDMRSDVFGLGAILAVILTGQPPFVGDSSETVRVMAAHGDMEGCFARLDSCGADPDLVALCRQCLCPKPAGRPADAREVAKAVADLRQAADERARQAELDRVKADAERARQVELDRVQTENERAAAEARAAERHKRRKVWAGAAAVLTATLVGALAVGLVAVWRERDRTREQKELAERNFDLAFQASNGGFEVVEFAEPYLASKQESMAARKKALVSGAVAFREFVAQKPDDDDLRLRAAALYRMTANVHRFDGEFAKAEQLYLDAIAVLTTMAGRPDIAAKLSQVYRDYAQAKTLQGKLTDADKWSGMAKTIADAQLTANPTDPARQRGVALTELDRAGILSALGRGKQAEAAAARAAGQFQELTSRTVGNGTHPYDPLFYGSALSRLGAEKRRNGKLPEALAAHREAVEQYQLYIGKVKRTDTEPKSVPPGKDADPKKAAPVRFEEINPRKFEGVNINDVYHLVTRARLEQARSRMLDPASKGLAELLNAVIDQWKNLVAAHPHPLAYRSALASAYLVRGDWLAGQGKTAEARTDFQQAQKLAEKLVADYPDVPGPLADLGRAWFGLAKLDKSPDALLKAKDALKKAADLSPDHAEVVSDWNEVRGR